MEAHFNKKFTFTKPSVQHADAWTLPPADTMYIKPIWQDEELQSLKSELNSVKQQLTDKDVDIWHTHTKRTNPAERIAHCVRRAASPEMVTQAWLKFYEIINTYQLIPRDAVENDNQDVKETVNAKTFNSIHLCEAPGAFIAALNHYLALNYPQLKWQWLGNTLNPYYEGMPAETCVIEDKFIYHTLPNWSFGQSNTGDLMMKENLEELIQCSYKLGQIDLVTADGSIDCQTAPAQQEKITHNLHLSEVLASLSILTTGGSLVVKKFTMFESETVNLMYLLVCSFEEVHVLKPGTSKEGNSEVYVVCIGYCGKDILDPHLQKLWDFYCSKFDDHLSMFSLEDLPKTFLSQLKKCAEIFKAHQINTITKNLTLFEKMTDKEKEYNDLLKCKANQTFLNLCFCDRIDMERTLTKQIVNKSRGLLENDLSKPITSNLVRSTCPAKKLELSKNYLASYIEEFRRKEWKLEIYQAESHDIYDFAKISMEKIEFQVMRGIPYKTIKTSKLCSQKVQEILRILNQIWVELDDAPELTFVEKVPSDFSTSEILNDTIQPAPSPDMGVMMELLLRIKAGRISQGKSFVLCNVTLLSRLQCGLFLVLSTTFQNVWFYTQSNYGEATPCIVMENFLSVEQGDTIIRNLKRAGWNPFEDDEDPFSVIQLVSPRVLLEPSFLTCFYHYNIHYCIHWAMRMQSTLEEVLKKNVVGS